MLPRAVLGSLRTVTPHMHPRDEGVGQPIVQAEAHACAQVEPHHLVDARARRDDAHDEEEHQAVGGEQGVASMPVQHSCLKHHQHEQRHEEKEGETRCCWGWVRTKVWCGQRWRMGIGVESQRGSQ